MDDMALAKIWLDRKVKHPENTTQKMADFIARIRAEARAEALKEAADKAAAFAMKNTGIGYANIHALRNAILADEPKE